MQNINSELYRTNIFYRDLVDKMLANEKEQKIRQLELEQQLRQRQAECERLPSRVRFPEKQGVWLCKSDSVSKHDADQPDAIQEHFFGYTKQLCSLLVCTHPEAAIETAVDCRTTGANSPRISFGNKCRCSFQQTERSDCLARFRWAWHHDSRQSAGCHKNCRIDCGYHRPVNHHRFEELSEQQKR